MEGSWELFFFSCFILFYFILLKAVGDGNYFYYVYIFGVFILSYVSFTKDKVVETMFDAYIFDVYLFILCCQKQGDGKLFLTFIFLSVLPKTGRWETFFDVNIFFC